MNYEDCINKIEKIEYELKDIKFVLKSNIDYKNELQNTTNDSTIIEAEHITMSVVHSLESGDNEYSTWDDLYGCIEELVLAYKNLKIDYEKYRAKDFSAEDM